MSNTNTKEKIETVNTIPGSWSTYIYDISSQANEAFKIALEGMVGINYSPIAFAQQVVTGMNYSFFCNAKSIYPGRLNEAVIINIYQPLKGRAVISDIQPIKR